MIEDADCREGKKEVISWIDHRTQDRLDRIGWYQSKRTLGTNEAEG
jgi:hypothetical protein